jgi:arylsulfatase A
MLPALLLAVLPIQGRDADAEDPRPNFVVVYVDDVGYGDLACYGNPVTRTPNLDRFAEEGMLFTSCYAGASRCSPSRAVLLTGRASYRTGVYDILSNVASDIEMVEEENTIAELLRGTGYSTAHFGKWHLTQKRNGDSAALKHGFDVTVFENLGLDLADRFEEWLEGREDKDRPFFAYLALNECHEPVEKRSPPEYQKLYEGTEEKAKEIRYPKRRPRAKWQNRNIYYGCVSEMDASFGRFLAALEAAGERENTFIYFSSDNGPARLSMNAWGSSGKHRGGKNNLYEGGIRVPGLIQWPGHLAPGAVSDEAIHAFDVLPTICEIAGVELPEDRPIDGTSLVPLLNGRAFEREQPLFWARWSTPDGPHCAIREGDWKLLGVYRPLDKDLTVVEYLRTVDFESFKLFNVADDPGERKELSEEHAEVFASMQATMREKHSAVMRDAPDKDLKNYRYKAGNDNASRFKKRDLDRETGGS